ncbi:hypothetical protein BD769DRAFT_1364201, partial [Suillus cothurnatus]
YPNLHRMALVFLVGPTSNAVKHVFSQGQHLLHFTRNRLCLSSTVHSSVLAHGLRCDLVAPEDLAEITKSLKKRKHEDESVG